MSNEEIKRAILEMDEREELAKDMLEQVRLDQCLIDMCSSVAAGLIKSVTADWLRKGSAYGMD